MKILAMRTLLLILVHYASDILGLGFNLERDDHVLPQKASVNKINSAGVMRL
jgi:hypothetical protein